MAGWQRFERRDEIADLLIVGMDADPSAEFLQHIDAGPSVRRIYHEKHRSTVRFEHAAQSSEPPIGVRKMMKNPGADNLIEARFQFVDALERKLADLEIVQVVFPLELLGRAHTGCAEVDAGDLSRRPTQSMLGRLRCPAPSNEDGLVFPIGSYRPEEMIVRPAFLSVLPEPSIFLKAVDWGWIGMMFVKGAHLFRNNRCIRAS